MKFNILSLLIFFSISLSAKKAPKWKDDGFKTSPSGLQYKIIKQGKGDSIRSDDVVFVDLINYDSNGKLLDNSNRRTYKQGDIIEMDDQKILVGIIQAVQLLKKGGKAYYKIPPSLGEKGKKDTLFCFIHVRNIIHKRHDVYPETPEKKDSVSIVIIDPEKKYYGDTLFSVMKLVEQPQMVSCGVSKMLIAFKFEMTYFENGMQHKNMLVFIECPDAYGKDYFVAGASYVVTCVPLLDEYKSGGRTMNSYSLEKLGMYYGLRVRKM